jgi:2-polyprenyl-3-methyl-5-hydroxy-6-metoxy-1,4-benzoquinol methylase
MPSTAVMNGTSCRVCSSQAHERVTVVPFDLPPRTTPSELHRCLDCGVYWRVFTQDSDISRHWEGRSYNHPEREELNRRKRQAFFEWIASIAWPGARNGQHKKFRVLDVGSSYGHLLDVFAAKNFDCVGVEPMTLLREQQNASGKYKIYGDVRELPPAEKNFDVITLIDSLYCFQDPVECLRNLGRRLSPAGVMIIRVTNRTPLLNLYRRFGKDKITNSVFGDQVIAFSHRSMEICIQKAQLRLRSFHAFEKKDTSGRGWKGVLYYKMLPVLAATTGWKITPGLTYTCVPA